MSTRAQTLRKATRQSSQLQNEIAQGQGTSLHASSSTEKENLVTSDGVAATVATTKHDQDGLRKRETKVAHTRAKKVYCSCRQPDDGTPMILCSECKEWYHFRCLSLSERDAEDIQLFVCPSCQEKTGLRSVMEWEGPEALEERKTSAVSKQNSTTLGLQPGRTSKTRQDVFTEPSPRKKKGRVVKKDEDIPEDTESSDDGSGDEYVTEEEGAEKRAKGKRRAVAPSSDSDTDGSEGRTKSTTAKKGRRLSTTSAISNARTRTASKSASPEPHARRRKSSTATAGEGLQPSLKRKRADTQSSQMALSTSGGGGEDAARKYCLSKLQDIFIDIFLRYPVLPDMSTTSERQHDEQGEAAPEKTAEQPTEEEKEVVRERARRFATELEECMFELYSEPDKTGKRGVAAKYRERFRMLSFNLSKPDRVALHKSISSSHITSRELSTMSSTDLANEETKQSIRQAEQAALAHSILKKTLLPRAKITHKGLEDIEDVNENGRREEREREREEEEEERIERERQERLKLQAERKSAQASGSVPPESPVTPHTPSWGGPPPVPVHAAHIGHGEGTMRPPLNPLFIPTASEMATPVPPVEGELNLADLINIDEEPGQEVSISLVSDVRLPTPDTAGSPSASTVLESPTQTSEVPFASPPPPTPTSSTGISPFASRTSYPEGTPRPSFDLNAIWSAQAPTAKEETIAPASLPEKPPHEEDDGEPMSLDSPEEIQTESPLGDEGTEEANDPDFDMFLDDGEDEAGSVAQLEQTPETQQAVFEALPSVWNGKLSMPLDSTIPQEVSVTAKQVGGRMQDSLSTAWKVLLPADHLRIDGRVPVDKSAQYLTQMRLNPNKELVAVAFSPDSQSSAIPFDTLSRHLIAKGRHGLIFPWGNRPKEHHPGRELYIVPLLSTEPIPDFVELLDELRLPADRTQSYLIGIWVLTRGKLETAAPPMPPPPEPVAPLPTGMLPPMPFSQLPLPLPLSISNPMQPSLPQPPNVNTSALAAEVASLTPEQIQAMLRTLTSTGAVPLLSQPPLPPPPMASIPPVTSQLLAPIPPIPPPSWLPGPTPYAPLPPYPPSSAPSHMQGPSPPPPPPSYGSSRRFDKELGRSSYGHDRDRDREERGHRRGRSGHGRGRGQGQGQSQSQQERQRDSGWRGRARTRSQGQSQGRGQWRDGGGQQQQWT